MIKQNIQFHVSPTNVRLDPVSSLGADSRKSADPPGSASLALDHERGPSEDVENIEPAPALAESVDAIFEAITDLEARRQQSMDELRELAVEVACTVVSHVVDNLMERGEFPFEKMIDQALEHLGVTNPGTVTVRMHPDDCHVMKEAWNEQGEECELPRRPILSPDATLKRGSCEATVEGRGVILDVEDQLNQIRHELLRTLNDAEAERRQLEKGGQHVQRYPDRRNTA